MKRAWQWPAIAAAAVLLLVACGGSDKKKDESVSSNPGGSGTTAVAAQATATRAATAREATATAASGGSTERVVAEDCLKGVKAYRYSGKLQIKGQGDLATATSLLSDVTLSGSFVAPDRTQTKLDLGSQGFETITIGADSWTRIGASPWVKSDMNPAGAINFSPDSFCRDNLNKLSEAGVKPSKDKVNGADVLKYEYDKKAIGRLQGVFGGNNSTTDDNVLPDNTKLTVWVTEKERWPVRITLTGDAKTNEQASFNIEFNITDLNKSDIKIDAPK